MTEEQERAVSNYNAAVKDVQKCKDARAGAPGDEVRRALAYQECVKLGIFPQIKAKYRNGKALKQVR